MRIKTFDEFIKNSNIVFCHRCTSKIDTITDKYNFIDINKQKVNICLSCDRESKLNKILWL
jgi:hypothetical protein